jgi:hypothetical protein
MIYKFVINDGSKFNGMLGYICADSRAEALKIAGYVGATSVTPSATGFEGTRAACDLVIRGKRDIRIKGRRDLKLNGRSEVFRGIR